MKRLFVSLILVIILVLSITPVVFAADSPESITITNAKAFRNLAETGDVLIIFHVDMPYPSDNYTETPVSSGIIYRLKTASGNVTQTDSPYVYPYFDTNGYGDTNGAFYMSASENWTWGSAGTIEAVTTTLLTPQVIQAYTLTSTDYSLETTQAANRGDLADYILLECDALESTYDDTDIVLKTTSDAGIILSPYGEAYWQGVINGLNTICPDLFFIQSSVPEVMDTTSYDLSAGDTIAARTFNDDMGEGFTNTASLFHLNTYAFWAIITAIVTVVACVITARKDWGIEPGLMIGAGIGSLMAFIMGGMMFGVLMLITFCAVIALVWLLLLKRA